MHATKNVVTDPSDTGGTIRAMTTVKKGDFIQMDASVAGLDFAYSPDQALEVGKDIDVGLANAYINDPPDEPRAHQISKADGERLKNEQRGGIEERPLSEVPRRSEKRQAEPEPEPEPEEEPEVDDDPDQDEGTEDEDVDEERSEQQGSEQATAPQAEKRETAVQKRSRKKVTPPEDSGESKFSND